MKSRLDQPELQPLRSDYQLLRDVAKLEQKRTEYIELIGFIIIGFIAYGMLLGTVFALIGG